MLVHVLLGGPGLLVIPVMVQDMLDQIAYLHARSHVQMVGYVVAKIHALVSVVGLATIALLQHVNKLAAMEAVALA